VFVTDFGLARLLASGKMNASSRSRGVGGTLAYMAPELLGLDDHMPTVAIDIFGIGAVLYSLLTGQAPFPVPGSSEIWRHVGIARPLAPPSTLRPNIPAFVESVCLT